MTSAITTFAAPSAAAAGINAFVSWMSSKGVFGQTAQGLLRTAPVAYAVGVGVIFTLAETVSNWALNKVNALKDPVEVIPQKDAYGNVRNKHITTHNYLKKIISVLTGLAVAGAAAYAAVAAGLLSTAALPALAAYIGIAAIVSLMTSWLVSSLPKEEMTGPLSIQEEKKILEDIQKGKLTNKEIIEILKKNPVPPSSACCDKVPYSPIVCISTPVLRACLNQLLSDTKMEWLTFENAKIVLNATQEEDRLKLIELNLAKGDLTILAAMTRGRPSRYTFTAKAEARIQKIWENCPDATVKRRAMLYLYPLCFDHFQLYGQDLCPNFAKALRDACPDQNVHPNALRRLLV